ncbi:MFS transporter [Scopulibacillus cellulosilyticus]|uniref:MFS transporter n=1 Tax=Scopulibacillus cellulosilyticus TaxID=2665665 RepID=A0ABW2PWL0_9BACL
MDQTNVVSFRFLWLGQMLANLGDVLYIVSLITLVYKVTDSVTLVSLIPFVITMTSLISGLLAPLMINKYKLKSILFYSQSGKTIILLILCLFTPYIGFDTLFLIYLLIAIVSFLDGWAMPARNALVPGLVEERKLVKVNSFLAISDQVTQLIAWPIGSVLLAAWGGPYILWLTFGLFIVSTSFMSLIKDKGIGVVKSEDGSSKWSVLKEGWQMIWESKQLRTISTMSILEAMANGVWIAAILLVYVSQALHKGEAWWGFINTSFLAGMILGGLLVYRYAKHLENNLGKTMMLASICLTVITLLFGMNSISWIALMFSLVLGLPQMARDVAETTIVQRSAKKERLAKIFSARGTLFNGAFGISSVLLGWLTDLFGVRTTFLTAAALFFCSFLIAFFNREYLFNSRISKN